MRGTKTRCSGQWTEARHRSFIISLLRAGSMKWRPQHEAIKKAFVRKGPNPRTGKPCNLCRCQGCGELFAQGELKADHRDPVVDPAVGFVDWNTYIARLFVEVDAYDALCSVCHDKKTAQENSIRVERRKAEK